MSDLQIFKSEQFGQVRTVIVEGDVWFVAKDVCDCLELSNPTKVVERLDEDEVTKFNLGGLSGETNIINEFGLYNLVLGSRKPEAKKFKRWITHEVIPSIRKTGSYSVGVPQTFQEALLLAAKLEGERQLAIQEKEEAIRTKAEIGSRREATAMNTASQLSKENKKLKNYIGECSEYATILAVERFYKKGNFNYVELRRYCIANELEIKKAPDGRYGKVNSYPAEAWLNVYGIDLEELF